MKIFIMLIMLTLAAPCYAAKWHTGSVKIKNVCGGADVARCIQGKRGLGH